MTSSARAAPPELQVRIGRIVLDGAALPRGARVDADELARHVAAYLGAAPPAPNAGDAWAHMIGGTVGEAIAARVDESSARAEVGKPVQGGRR